MLKLYDTLTRQLEEVRPLKAGEVGMYTCGPTVYREPHIGNYRSYLMADWIRRVLEAQGIAATQTKNITDVGHMRQEQLEQGEDKVIAAALAEGKTPQEIADFYTEGFMSDELKLGILPATNFPRATDHIPEMLEIVEKLVEDGYAYEVSGNVYYDVSKFAPYGALSGNVGGEALVEGVRVEADPLKHDPRDFTLWKAAEPGRELKWPSRWGEGFPGWHIECSAMSIKYLGRQFDIHTGGVDNIFPHHEGEIAQNEGYTGSRVVNTWVHGQHLLADGVKMAKSTGNSFTLGDIEAQSIDPLAFRYLCLTVGYRTRMNFTFTSLKAAQRALLRLRNRAWEWGLSPDDLIKPPVVEEQSKPVEQLPESSDASLEGEEDGATAPGGASPADGASPTDGEPLDTEEEALTELELPAVSPVPEPEPEDQGPEIDPAVVSEWVVRFFEDVNDDLDMPKALARTWALAKADLPGPTKLEILRAYDGVLGLAVDGAAGQYAVPGDILERLQERAVQRQRRRYKRADAIRDELVAEGYVVEDTPDGTRVRPKTAWETHEEAWPTVSSPADVASFLGDADWVDLTVGVVASNYVDDVCRCIQSALAWSGSRSVEVVVVDNGSTDETGEWLAGIASKDARVRVTHTDHPLGEGAAKNVVLMQSRGRTVVLLDPSVEVRGDIYTPIEQMLTDVSIGVVGPFGLRTSDLHHFHDGEGEPGDMDAMQAYCFALRAADARGRRSHEGELPFLSKPRPGLQPSAQEQRIQGRRRPDAAGAAPRPPRLERAGRGRPRGAKPEELSPLPGPVARPYRPARWGSGPSSRGGVTGGRANRNAAGTGAPVPAFFASSASGIDRRSLGKGREAN